MKKVVEAHFRVGQNRIDMIILNFSATIALKLLNHSFFCIFMQADILSYLLAVYSLDELVTYIIGQTDVLSFII